MATYNGAKYIREQIDSIITQLGEDDELVISDDGSTDDTLTIIESYCDPRIKLLHHKHPSWNSKNHKTNVYVTSNFENALSHSTGDVIFLSDQDDIWEENKVEKMVSAIKQTGGIVMSSTKVIKSDGTFKKIAKPQKYSFLQGVRVAKYLGSSMAISREFLNHALPFPKGIVSHDAWLGCLATYIGKLQVIDEPLLLYRRHGENVTSKNIRTSMFSKVKYRIVILVNVLLRARTFNKEK